MGLRISRILFSILFSTFGPFFKSEKIIKKNLNIFSNSILNLEEKKNY